MEREWSAALSKSSLHQSFQKAAASTAFLLTMHPVVYYTLNGPLKSIYNKLLHFFCREPHGHLTHLWCHRPPQLLWSLECNWGSSFGIFPGLLCPRAATAPVGVGGGGDQTRYTRENTHTVRKRDSPGRWEERRTRDKEHTEEASIWDALRRGFFRPTLLPVSSYSRQSCSSAAERGVYRLEWCTQFKKLFDSLVNKMCDTRAGGKKSLWYNWRVAQRWVMEWFLPDQGNRPYQYHQLLQTLFH